jgi:hypothetical protein
MDFLKRGVFGAVAAKGEAVSDNQQTPGFPST